MKPRRIESALLLVATLAELDTREERHGLPRITDQDHTWPARVNEIVCRLQAALNDDGPPDLDLLEAAGAHLLALHQCALAAQVLRVESGDREAA